MVIPVKSISELEVKSEVSVNDKILILDSVSEEARLASKDELKGDPWTPWQDWEDGAAATITVWSTTTGTPWSSASVTNSWTSSAAVLDFTIPQWAKWEPWQDGEDWQDWAAATITVWTTTTLPAWSSATVTNVWTSQDAILNFWIPKWDSWSWSWDVNWPASSVDWDVVVFDWTTGKAIKDWSVSLATLSAWASAWATAVQPWDIGTAAACNTWTSSWNVPILDSNWKLATSTLPWVALTDTFTVSTSSDLTSLSSADQWDIAIVTTENKTYVLSVAPYSTAANWKEILSPTGWVTSVNGNTWAVTVSEFNATNWGVKIFSMPSAHDDMTDIATWLSNWWNIILKETSWWVDQYYWVASFGSGAIVATSITSASNRKMIYYNTVTKKCISATGYEDKFFKPWGTATTWYVVTKTALGYEWAAPSGWSSTITVTLTSAWWSSSTQTVTATGVTASNTVIVSPAPSSIADYTAWWVYCSAQGTNSLTFTCDTDPSNDITVNVVILG